MKHSPTHPYRGHQSSLICFLHLLQSMASYLSCSIYVPDSLFPQSLSKFCLICLLAWHPALHTPYISLPNHCLLFTGHAHTISPCFSVVPKLCHLNLVSLSTLYSELYLVTSHHTSILPFSTLPSEVPPHFPFFRARSHFHATYYFARNATDRQTDILITVVRTHLGAK